MSNLSHKTSTANQNTNSW